MDSRRTGRRFDRIYLDCNLEIEFETENFVDCQLKDLSLVGMFVKGVSGTKEGEHCIVHLTPNDQSLRTRFKALAQVVRVTEKGFALTFTSMSPESYMFLQTILLYECNEPLSMCLQIPDSCPFQISEQDVEIPKK